MVCPRQATSGRPSPSLRTTPGATGAAGPRSGDPPVASRSRGRDRDAQRGVGVVLLGRVGISWSGGQSSEISLDSRSPPETLVGVGDVGSDPRVPGLHDWHYLDTPRF